MKYFAHIDMSASAAAPVRAFGWASNDSYVLPADCVAMTAEQWAARAAQSWYDPAAKVFVAPVTGGGAA